MRVVSFAACRKLLRSLGAAITLILIGTLVVAQTPAPTQDQLNIFKSLTQDQQDALLQSVLGKGDATSKKSDSQLNSPETVDKKNDRTGERGSETERGKTIDGRTLRNADEDPELRADDYVLIDLTPVELSLKDNNAITPAGTSPGAPNPSAGTGNASSTLSGIGDASNNKKNNESSDFGRLKIDPATKTPEQMARTATLRDRILKGNPYKLNHFGVLEIPGLPAIPLAGLTADEATRR